MTAITVSASKEYQVIVDSQFLLEQVGDKAREICKATKAAIISDSNVWPLYGETVRTSLEKAGIACCNYTFPAGEASKNGETYLSILNFLAENRLSRSDLLIALGGGVVGDITGFAAATFLRGIAFIQLPTTLLSMVDSSVGGKTAIDLPAGKNLAGAFYQPSLVLCDLSTLQTLPQSVFIDGCAEVIKYGILYDDEMITHLEDSGLGFDREAVVSRCIAHKRDVVAQDEFDHGSRQKLNLGHTIGHGVEAASNFTISHGQAVAIGMAIVTKAAASTGFCDYRLYDRILAILNKFHLPIETQYCAQELYRYALSDKKRSGSHLNLIVPREIGNCVIHTIALEDIQTFIESGL